MDAARLWRAKTDDEVLNAYQQLDDYTDEGQRLVTGELERRQLTPIPLPPPSPAVAEIAFTNPIARLWAGGYPLPIAYWVWGQVGGFAWGLVGFMAVSSTVREAWGLALLAYMVLVGVGVWRSAGHYKGSPGWATLARVSVLAPVGMSVIRALAAALASKP